MEQEMKGTQVLAFSLIIAAAAVLYCLIFSSLQSVLFCSLLFVFIPIVSLGLYMHLTGKGLQFVNGINFTVFEEDTQKSIAQLLGKYFTAGFTIITILVSAIVSGLIRMDSTTVFICIIIVILLSLALSLWPLIKVRKPEKILALKPLKQRTLKQKWTILAVYLIAVTAVSGAFFSIGEEYTVDVDLNETSFTVTAPMFNHTFTYEKVESIELDENFDRGFRKWGYGTSTVCSGKFSNDEFGNYELASYTKCKSCIVILYDGEIYAFNQATVSETQTLYDEIVQRCSVI